MRTRGALRGVACASKTTGFKFTIGIALLTLCIAGCGTQSGLSANSSGASLGDLPGERTEYGQCRTGQKRVCHVGWPSRLKGKEGLRSCYCE